MKLIREEIESVEFIVENRGGKKQLYIEGVFLQGNIKNRNGRMYPMETLRREVSRYNENHVVSGRALVELGHPEGPTTSWRRREGQCQPGAQQATSTRPHKRTAAQAAPHTHGTTTQLHGAIAWCAPGMARSRLGPCLGAAPPRTRVFCSPPS